jgi:predicted acetyltransferase
MAAEGAGLSATAMAMAMSTATTRLVAPGPAHLAAFDAALARGYLPAQTRGAEIAAEYRALIANSPGDLLARMHDPLGLGPDVITPDGSSHRRLPSTQRWMFDGPSEAEPDEFVGSISLRWNHAHAALPPHVLGHIGYSVVPWAQRRGHATRALAAMLPIARALGLLRVEITTDLDNAASQKVIVANGGRLVGEFDKGPAWKYERGLRYVIEFDADPAPQA